ncbi:transcriptional regulator [Tamilnaduibacter salinus]|uniref:Transcriptional regulator n=1 Tax=Tamilnaduibacter salinus TaxID=1484056 RepID=A0A2A2I5C7_9GAMM|nr:helix-turn-helix transcriptional regulator [Tamilnaduibacter salinus]PAV26335.1 transcriptional regulator [Tamilnaduibacter salinus]
MAADEHDREQARALESLLMDALHTMQSMDQAEQLGDGTLLSDTDNEAERESGDSLVDRLTDLTGSAFRFAQRTTGTSIKVGRALMRSQDQLKRMVAAGESLRDIREVAGLTLSEMSDALDMSDKSLLEAVENGTATLSFELILRLAALLARNDPIPFILRYTRTYNPEVWRLLNDWGVGRIPLQFERERQFINILRGRDDARTLSDEGFEQVLAFTRQSFEMSLHFVAEQENRVANATAANSAPDDGQT